MFFLFFGRWFSSETIPGNSSSKIVCSITVKKQLSFSKKNDIKAILDFFLAEEPTNPQTDRPPNRYSDL